MKIWRSPEVEVVLGECTEGLALIVKLVRATYVEPAPSVTAWGQYLDDEHRTDEHWGLYGTAAAVQCFVLHVISAGRRPQDQPLVEGAMRLLPEDPARGHALLAQKRAKGDFDNVLKLAAVAEALRPDDSHIAMNGEPLIVKQLRKLALSEGGWTTRPEGAPQRDIRERDLATAYILHSLRRYDLDEEGLSARRWLAGQVIDGAPMKGWDLLALTGLALTAHAAHPADPPVVGEAIERVDQRLTEWSRDQHPMRVDRPMFKGFSIGATTDYLFLHPEILATLYFLRRRNPVHTRAFVIEVAQAVSRNIKRNKGLTTSNGVIAAVDQLWSMRLLLELRELHRRDGLQAIMPSVSEREVRDLARARMRSARGHASEALRLRASREAGYRRRATHGLAVVTPITLAVPVAVIFFQHAAEGIGALILGVLGSIGVGYYFFFRGKDT